MSLIILNRESIMNEVVLFAKWQMANILKVDDKHVQASWSMGDDGKLRPKFDVDAVAAEGVTPAEIKEVVSSVYHDVQSTLSTWLKANEECRDGSEEGRYKPTPKEKGESKEGSTEDTIDPHAVRLADYLRPEEASASEGKSEKEGEGEAENKPT